MEKISGAPQDDFRLEADVDAEWVSPPAEWDQHERWRKAVS